MFHYESERNIPYASFPMVKLWLFFGYPLVKVKIVPSTFFGITSVEIPLQLSIVKGGVKTLSALWCTISWSLCVITPLSCCLQHFLKQSLSSCCEKQPRTSSNTNIRSFYLLLLLCLCCWRSCHGSWGVEVISAVKKQENYLVQKVSPVKPSCTIKCKWGFRKFNG